MNTIVLFLSFLFTLNIFAVEFTVYDSLTGKLISDSGATIRRENTIRCGSAPCHSNEMDHKITIDKAGKVKITDKSLLEWKEYLILIVKDYFPVRIKHIKDDVVYLRPAHINNEYHEVKFIDKFAKKPITNQKVWFSTTKDCVDGACSGIVFKGETNKFGIVYYKFLEIFPKGLAQMDPVYLFIKGYEPYTRHHHHRGEAQLISVDFMKEHGFEDIKQ